MSTFQFLTTFKLNRFNSRINNNFIKLADLQRKKGDFLVGISKALYEQLKPLDEEKPNKLQEKLFGQFKEFQGKNTYQQQSDLIISSNGFLKEIIQLQMEIQDILSSFFDVVSLITTPLEQNVNSFNLPLHLDKVGEQLEFLQFKNYVLCEDKILQQEAQFPSEQLLTGFHYYTNQYNESGDAVLEFTKDCKFAPVKLPFYKQYAELYEGSNFIVLSSDTIQGFEILPPKEEKEEVEEQEEKEELDQKKEGEEGEEKEEKEKDEKEEVEKPIEEKAERGEEKGEEKDEEKEVQEEKAEEKQEQQQNSDGPEVEVEGLDQDKVGTQENEQVEDRQQEDEQKEE